MKEEQPSDDEQVDSPPQRVITLKPHHSLTTEIRGQQTES
jgi:hypothetical protein